MRAGSTTQDVVFSPDSQTLASAHNDACIRLWDVQSGRLIAELQGHEDNISRLAISSDGKTLASVSNDGTVRLWSVGLQCEFGVVERRVGTANAVAFAPDGRGLAVGWDSKRWDGGSNVLYWRTDISEH